MKKIITTILAATLILSTTACGQNTEIEALKEENEQLRAQLEDSNKPTETPTENIITPESLSDKYDQIQYGMSYSQVVEILGSEGTVSRSISNPMPDNCDYYVWQFNINQNTYDIMIRFQNDSVIKKDQIGLSTIN